jgi:ABC-2 type transport system permease protein
MTWILVRKLLRDVRPALIVVCILLFAFAALWVKITQRVTTEITPFFNIVAKRAGSNREAFEKVLFRGPGKVSQAVLGGADLQFQEPNDFLAVGLLHPVVLILSSVWGIGRAAGAVSGELDRGTMELLMSQPVPRNRLILAHFLVDCVSIPTLCLSFFAGTQFGLWAVGPFTVDYSAVQELKLPLPIPDEPEVLPVSGARQLPALANQAALIFALSGITMALSAAGRSRMKVIGLGLLAAVVMFIINVLGQLWDTVGFLRPVSVFFYYQPQKIMIRDDWSANLGEAWPGVGVGIPVVGMLLLVGAVGYGFALRIFTRRDLPAPL